ncbi:MAG: tRNA pseudouridine(38-40) synthase TruA [Acidimicrobiia bacterium]|nr:tRNA pseudouridine(38-40) synthase TruA [Acidimicrobiia bacterium]
MPVIRLDLAYDGTGFRGYARQPGQRTIQGVLEDALEALLGEVPETAVAGRTDAGVHARGQVVSFDHEGELDLGELMRSLNGLVGPEISITDVIVAAPDFSARFSATARRYRYLIDTRPASDPLTRGFVWHVGRDLDLEAMAAASADFVGEHDFTSFCRSVEDRSNVRRVHELTWSERDGVNEMWIQANAFCHQMVRSIVGHLYDIGRGFAPADAVPDVIAARDRSAVATVAPPHGLTLWSVSY